MKTNYLVANNMVRLIGESNAEIIQEIAPDIYEVHMNPKSGEFFLVRQRQFLEDYSKIYGQLEDKAQKVIDMYEYRLNRHKNTGVLFSGLKGAGKTLLTKLISKELLSKNVPTFIINQGFPSQPLSAFIQSISTKAFVIFDEFDKNYSSSDDDTESQEGLLNFLDNVHQDNKLIAFCCNSTSKINPYFLSRPSRIFYHFRFSSISESIISEYCKDQDVPANIIKDILLINSISSTFSFDIIKSIIDEYKLNKISPLKSINYLNIDINSTQRYTMDLVSSETGKSITSKIFNRSMRIDLLDLAQTSEHFFFRKSEMAESTITKFKDLVDSDGDLRIGYRFDDKKLIKKLTVDEIIVKSADYEIDFVFSRLSIDKTDIPTMSDFIIE